MGVYRVTHQVVQNMMCHPVHSPILDVFHPAKFARIRRPLDHYPNPKQILGLGDPYSGRWS